MLWKTVMNAYKKIRRYTIISGIFKAIGIALTLLEKSAVLLLFATCLVLTLPVILFIFVIYAIFYAFKCIYLHKRIRGWLLSGENATVFITKERIFSKTKKMMFLSDAMNEASRYTHPVIVICSDRFIAAKWYSLNLLAVKTDYFFILKRRYLSKRDGKTTYIVL